MEENKTPDKPESTAAPGQEAASTPGEAAPPNPPSGQNPADASRTDQPGAVVSGTPAQVIVSPPPGTGAPPTSGKLQANRFIYKGTLGALYRIWLTQLFLSILTLGIYHFWGKTNMRRYFFGALELAGDRLEYLGTGKELFLGMLKIIPLYICFMVFLGLAQHVSPKFGVLLVYPVIFYVIPVAQYSGFRYRVNRISWRGIRGYMGGSAAAYGWKYLGGMLLSFVTIGIMNPAIDLKRWQYQVDNMRFGSQRYAFKGNPANLRKVNIITLVLAIPTLFISRVWYQAALQREMMRGLSLGNMRFRSAASGGDIMKFRLANMLIMIVTLGIGYPVVIQRTMRFYAKVFAIGGDVNAFNAEQAALGKPGDAEGLLDVLDVDIGMIGA